MTSGSDIYNDFARFLDQTIAFINKKTLLRYMEPYYITSKPMIYHNPWLHKLTTKATGYDTPGQERSSIDDIVDIDELNAVQPTPRIPMQESTKDCVYMHRYDTRGRAIRNYSQEYDKGKHVDERA